MCFLLLILRNVLQFFVGGAAYLVLGCSKLLSNVFTKMAARETTVDPSTKCKKCHNHYDDPRMLPCLHSFCKSCVGQLVIQNGSKKTVRCPTCYSTSPLPLKGVDVFPRNVRLSYEATITKYEAQIKSKTPPSCGECRRDPPLETVSFCCTCRSFLCKECHTQHTLSRKTWVYHKIIILKQPSDTQSTLKQNIPQPSIACRSQHPEKTVEFFCTDCSVLVCVQCALIQHRGHEFEELNKLSRKKRVEIKESVQTMPDSITKLEETLANGMNTKKELKVSKEAVDDQIHKAFKEMREELNRKEKALLAKSSEISTAKETSLTIQLEELTSLKDQMVACTAVVAVVQESYNDQELLSVVTTLQTRVQELTQRFDETPLKLREDGKILLAINITTLGCEISKLGTVQKPPRDYKTLKEPVMSISSDAVRHVAVHDNGDIFATGFDSHCVHVYDKNGTNKATYGSQGEGNGQFNYPMGIAVVGDVMFVCQFYGKRVQKLTTGGQFLFEFGTSGQLQGPRGCAVSSDGKVYIAEKNKHCVQVFNPDGKFSHTIGQGEVKSPTAVAIDSNGNIHVASFSLKFIKIYTPTGELIREYGSEQLNGPSGLAVDDNDYCLVGDWKGNSLCIFDPQGKLVHSIKFPGICLWCYTRQRWIRLCSGVW